MQGFSAPVSLMIPSFSFEDDFKDIVKESYSEIIAGLYVSNDSVAKNDTLLKSLGITHILNAVSNEVTKKVEHVVYKDLSLLDHSSEKIERVFKESIEFINMGLSEGRVLVHCRAGISRSVTLTIAYLMSERGMSFEDAKGLVKAKRPIADPNHGFIEALKKFEKELEISTGSKQ